MSHHDIRFPNESDEYRAAREELLDLEIELRSQIERVAAARRRLPVGGEIPADYGFSEIDVDGQKQTVALSDLFGPESQTLLLYSFMYGPNMDHPCPACTSLIDGLNGANAHITARVPFAVVAQSPIGRFASFAETRGWKGVRLLSSAGTRYHQDYHGEDSMGVQQPVMNVFVKRDGEVRHFWSSEVLFAKLSGHPRHADLFWPIWNLFDLTPEGRGDDFFPRLEY